MNSGKHGYLICSSFVSSNNVNHGSIYLVCLLTTTRTVKSSRSHSNQPNRTPSGVATPTIDDTSTFLDRGVGTTDRSSVFKNKVSGSCIRERWWLDVSMMQLLQRDGYQCIVAGRFDRSHPVHSNSRGARLLSLKGCHIIRRSVAIFDSEGDRRTVRPPLCRLRLRLIPYSIFLH